MRKNAMIWLCCLAWLLVAVMPANVGADWWLDTHYDSRLAWADDEVWAIDSLMEPETLHKRDITVWVFGDWQKSWIISGSLPVAKIFHMASHGGIDFDWGWLWGSNFLVTHLDERIYGGEVPSLRNVHDRGCQLFTFESSCYSGRSSAGWYMLYQGFLDNGAIAYMGYWSPVGDYDAYLFAYWFYYYISRFYTVKESMDLALSQVPGVSGNIQLYGNGGIFLVDA